MRTAAVFISSIVALMSMPAASSCRAEPPLPVDLRILAINDFHGYLRASSGGIRIADPSDKTKKITVPAGGAEQMATLVKELAANRKNTIFVAAGDLIGASPLLSAMPLEKRLFLPLRSADQDNGLSCRHRRPSRQCPQVLFVSMCAPVTVGSYQ